MTRTLEFYKYHGLGNDFVLLDEPIDRGEALRLCDRKRGIGADGVLVIGPPPTDEPTVDATVDVWNSDGSKAEICGNGLRCAALHLHECGGASSPTIHLGTPAGVKRCFIEERIETGHAIVEVEMGRPVLDRDLVPFAGERHLERMIEQPLELGDRVLRLTAVGLGNPHAVTFDDAADSEAPVLGPLLEHHARFPAGVNAGFATMKGTSHLLLTVWERGAGLTGACGSGACAAVVAACLTSRALYDEPIVVEQAGGLLTITVKSPEGPVIMKGEAQRSFSGSIEL